MMADLKLFLPEATVENMHALARKRGIRLGDLLRDLVTEAYMESLRGGAEPSRSVPGGLVEKTAVSGP